MTLGKSVLRPGGCTGKWFELKLRMRGDSKLNPRDFTPYRTKLANTFRQGPVAGNCKLQGMARGMESLKLDLRFQRGHQVQDHVVHRCMVWVIGVFSYASGECEPTGQRRETTCKGYQS